MPAPRHVVVVGGGISGLAAAWFLHRDGPPGLRVTRARGQRTGWAGRCGSASSRAYPSTGAPRRSCCAGRRRWTSPAPPGWGRTSRTPPPRAPRCGAAAPCARCPPARSWASRGTCARWPGPGCSPAASWPRIPLDAWLPRTRIGEDVSVGRYVTARMGRAVLDRLVEPLLGGVYAGRADELSLEATLPQLAPYVRHERSLLAAVRASRVGAPAADGAVFGAPRGGVGRLPQAVARLCGAHVRTGAPVRELARTPTGWRLTVGPASGPGAGAGRRRRPRGPGRARRPAAAGGRPGGGRRAGAGAHRLHGGRRPRLRPQVVPDAARAARASWSPRWKGAR